MVWHSARIASIEIKIKDYGEENAVKAHEVEKKDSNT